MVRKSINYIFIYIISLICIGCESNILGNNFEGCVNDCVLEMDAQDLEMDSNGFYHLNMIDGFGRFENSFYIAYQHNQLTPLREAINQSTPSSSPQTFGKVNFESK